MRLKITTTAGEKKTTIRIEGELMRGGVSELDKARRTVDGAFDLDLSELMRADEEGVRALKKLRSGGARLVATSPYIELLLESEEL